VKKNAKHPNVCEQFLPKPPSHRKNVNFSFWGKSWGVSIVEHFMNRKHESMTSIVEIWDEIGFAQYFVINLNGKRILYHPLPSHNRKSETKQMASMT